MVAMHFQAGFLHVTFMSCQKQEAFGFLLLWPSERIRPTSLSYIFLSIKTGGDLDVNKCNLHFFTTPPHVFFCVSSVGVSPDFPRDLPEISSPRMCFLGGGSQNVTLKLSQTQNEATFYAFA